MARREGKKAPNGAGSEWYDPGRGLYFAAYTRGLRPDGTAYVKRFSSKASQAEANRKRDEDRDRWRRNIDTPAWMELQTTGQFLRRRWFPTRKAASEKLRRWEASIRLHVDPDPPKDTSIGHLRLRRLRHTDLARLYDSLTPSVALSVQQMLHVAFKRARQWGDLVGDSPADLVDAPTYGAPEMHPPTADQIVAFFACAEEAGDPNLAVWYWLCDTGCRPGEMLGVEWADIDADGEWFVQRQRSTTPPPVRKEIRNKQRRRVQLTDRLLSRLRARREAQLALIAAAGDAWKDLGLVFANRLGGPLLWSNVTPDFKVALRRAGLPALSPYVFFRHAHVTIALASDVAIQDVAKRTGHTVEVLERVYAHRVASRDREAARRFERATSREQSARSGGEVAEPAGVR
jgi:integrase